MDLAELRFAVDTSQLEKADKAIANLAVSIGKLNVASDKSAAVAAKVEAAEAKKTKELTKAAIESERLAVSKAKTAKAEAAATVAAEKAALAIAKTEIATTKAEAASARLAKSKQAEASAVKEATSIQQRQNDILNFMQEGYTRGQSSILAYAKSAGEATDEIAKILDLQRKLIGGDPFDKSLSGVKALKNELAVMTQVQNLYNTEAGLTSKQVRELARDEERLLQIMKSRGATDAQIESATAALKAEYMGLATQINAVTEREKALLKAKKDAAAGSKYILDTDARLAAALDATNNSLDRRATDTMVKYKAALVAMGYSSDQVAVKMQDLKGRLDAVASKEREQQLRHLSRAISVQMGDVAISLASGMNPLLVMIQQGDQIRGVIEQTGAKGKELTTAMSQGAATIARSFKDTAIAIGTFFGGAIESAGKSIIDFFIAPIRLAVAALSDLKNGTDTKQAALENLKASFISTAKLGVLALAAALGVLAVEYYKIIKAETELSKAITLTGASLGLSKETAIEYARSLSDVAGTTLKAQQAIAEIAKVGNITGEQLGIVTKAAIELEKYGGVAISETAKRFAEIADKPVDGLIKLGKETGNVEVAVIKQVKSLIDQKKYAEASAVAIAAAGEASKKTADTLKSNLTPIEKIWVTIKENINKAIEAIYDIATTDELVGAFGTIWQAVAVTVSEVGYTLKQIGLTIGGVSATLAAMGSGDFALAGRIARIMVDDSEKARVEQEKLVAGILAVNAVDAKATREMAARHRAEAEARKNNSAEVAAYERDLKDEKGKKEPKTASGTLPTPRSNELAEIKKRFDNELQIAKQYNQEERAVLKAKFDAGLIDRGQFIAEDTAMLQESEKRQLTLLEQYQQEYSQKYVQRYLDLVQARDKALAGNKGLKDESKANAKIVNDFATAIENMGNEAETTFQFMENLKKSIATTADARQLTRILDFNKATFENEKAYIAFTNSIRDKNREQAIEIEYQKSLIGVSDEVAARLKAEYEEMKRLAPEIRKFNDEVIKAKRELDAATSVPEADPTVIQAARDRYVAAMDAAEKVISDSRVQVHKVGTDAVIAYYQSEFKRISDSVADAIVTAMFDGGKAGSKKLRDIVVAELKKPVTMMVSAIVNPILGDVMGAFGFGPSSSGATSANSLSTASSAISTGKSLMDVVSLGFTGAITSQLNKLIFSDVGKMLGLSKDVYSLGSAAAGTGTGLKIGAGGANGLSTTAAGTTGISATASTSAGADLKTMTDLGKSVQSVGISLVTGFISGKIRNAIAGGYKMSGGGELILDMANIAASFFGPIAQLAVGALSGLISRTFGRKLTEVGVKGTFGGTEGFTGEQYTFEKGGFLRSDKTRTSPLDAKTQQGLADQFNKVRTSILMMSAGLGIGADAIVAFTKDVKVNLKGLSEADAVKELEKVFLEVQEDLAKVALGTEEYSRANETSLETLTRLHDVLGTVNATFDNLGFKLYDLSLANADAAQSFVDLFGTIDKFKEATSKYYNSFYTEQEKLSNLMRQLTTAFGNLGYELPRTKEQFREIGDAAMQAGDEKTFAGLLSIQDQFLSMLGMIESRSQSIKDTSTSYQDYQRKMQDLYVPGFASGGSYPGGLALVGEQGPELINFSQPGHIYDSAETSTILSSGSSGMISEMQNLRYEVSLLRAEVRADVSHNAKTARLLERVTPDGDSLQVVTIAPSVVTVTA